MTEEELNTALYKKVFDEQEQFRNEVLCLPAEKILEKAYELVIRDDILLSLEYDDLPAERCEALLSEPDTLSALYDAYENGESRHMEDIRNAMEFCADQIMRNRHFYLSTPIYPETAKYAREHDELNAYRNSNNVNIECRRAIEDVIYRNYADNRLNMACVSQVVERFGYERTLHVLANAIRHADWDERFSPSNRAWAKEHGTEDKNAQACCIINSHPGLIDLFLTRTLKEQAKEAEKKPPLKERLKPGPEQSAPVNNKPHQEAER